MSLAIVPEALTLVAGLRLRGTDRAPRHPAMAVRIPRWQARSPNTEDEGSSW
jgi:hypothetical protein